MCDIRMFETLTSNQMFLRDNSMPRTKRTFFEESRQNKQGFCVVIV